jgi:hypothetical protein
MVFTEQQMSVSREVIKLIWVSASWLDINQSNNRSKIVKSICWVATDIIQVDEVNGQTNGRPFF